jgi:polysaccharide export outer membrane protein
MKRTIVTLTTAVFLYAAAISAVYAGDYRIGPGDVLDISVWKNPDLTRQLAVLPDGMIHFPLVKGLKVGGITVNELEEILVAKLKKYVPEPDLSISVVQVNSMMIYVIGKVNHPGRFSINTNIDVLQALAVSGGLNPFAKEKQIAIFRKRDGETLSFNFNYEEVSQGKNIKQNIMLERGDVIVVR